MIAINWFFLFYSQIINFLCSVWVARRPPGYAFIDFEDRRDAEDAIREIDGMCERFSSFYNIFLVFYACF